MENPEQKFLEEIKEAAREGAREGAKEGMSQIKIPKRRGGGFIGGIFGTLVGKILSIVVVIALIGFVINSINPFGKINLGFEKAASEHDLVLNNQGILGYTAVDFADAILGDQSKLCKLEVLNQQVSDAASVIDTGFVNWSVFSKTQLITYHGTATYTVDLSKLSTDDFKLDEDSKELTIYIPHAQLEPINIQSDEIEFGDVSRGLIAFGDIKATPEDMANAQSEAEEMMEKKLDEQNIIEQADRFAKLQVWELFQPVVNGVTEGYSLIVEFSE